MKTIVVVSEQTSRAVQLHRRGPAAFVASLAVILASLGAQAEPDAESSPGATFGPLITDRPDFTESTEAIPPGRFQLEAGYTFTYNREGDNRVRDQAAPELLLRIGVVEAFEIRIGWDGYSWTNSQFEGETRGGRRVTREDWALGAHDFSVGIKYKLLDQNGLTPHFGIIGAISAPSGSPGVSSGDADPELVFLWAYDLTHSLSVAGNVGLSLPTDGRSRFFQTSASISGAFSITERVGTYVEYFGFYPHVEHSDAAHTVNGGLTYLINNDFQIDWRIGAGLNEEADDFFTGVGVAWRF